MRGGGLLVFVLLLFGFIYYGPMMADDLVVTTKGMIHHAQDPGRLMFTRQLTTLPANGQHLVVPMASESRNSRCGERLVASGSISGEGSRYG